ncbi:MAG: glycosyltransferase family 4 protein, partial [Planctomycetota bacterium]
NGPSCREYLRQLQVPDDDLFHLPYAADDRNVPACMPTKDDTACRGRLLCVGQLSQRKGVVPMLHSLCEYARKHTDRKLDIVFVGEGSMRDELRNISMPENLTIRMEGIVPAARIPEFAATCGAAIAPTLADEWLLVTNESLHQGLPLIGSRYAQSVETLIRDGVNGWSYDPLQSESLHASLDAYFALDSAAYQTMRETCVRSIAHRTPAWAAAGALQAIGHVLRQRDGEIALTDNATEVNGEP